MTTAAILDALRDLRVLVVGDIVLDRWCAYDPAAGDISRETSLTRIGVIGVERTAGAGGTVANNLAGLGVRPVQVLGIIGDDGHGFELRQALHSRGIGDDLLVRAADYQTFTYTKLINTKSGEEDLPRVDFINVMPPPPDAVRAVLERLEQAWTGADIVIVADQAETEVGGVVGARVRERIMDLARQDPKKAVWVDSRLRIDQFRSVIAKPNRTEAEAACRRTIRNIDFGGLRSHLMCPVLMITDGERGALVVDADGEHSVPARVVPDPVDICGAGDSFMAGAACAYTVTGSAIRAAEFGNLVASVTVRQKGTGAATPAEVLAAEGR